MKASGRGRTKFQVFSDHGPVFKIIMNDKMIEVKSANLAKVGYEDQEKVLKIQFKDGQEYWYFDVPRIVFDDMLKAESVGKFFVKNVKGVKYQYKKVEKEIVKA